MSSKPETPARSPDQRIVFFDGLCHLCSGFVDHLILHDPRHRLHFASLQGETARNFLSPEQIQGGSLIFWSHGKVFSHSTAVLRAVAELGGSYSLLRIFLGLPRPLLDFFYNIVARNRYAWFGERKFCRVPQPQEKDFLLP